MKFAKKQARIRRATKFRAKHAERGVERLCVYKSSQHIYAQIISSDGDHVITSASTLSKDLRKILKRTGNKDAAAAVGKLIAERAKEQGVERVAFDRSGFNYHGRIKALADAAREAGLGF